MIKIDLSYLQSISGGDKAFINEMLTMFLNTTFPDIEQLKTLAASKQWEQMSSIAHKMKAPIQMLGVPQVSALVLDIEQTGRAKKDTDAAEQKIAELAMYITQMEKQIAEILAA
jgi:HPt (histidine-containing phosphotransfer) domain-containing protein